MKDITVKTHLPIDDDGREIINLVVHDDSDFLSPYSESSQEIVSQEVASFLDSKAKLIKQNKPLHIVVKSDKIEESERETCTRAIKNYYYNEKIDLERTLKFYLISSLILTIAAVVIFALLYLWIINANIEILSEIITVIGWVFLWEAVDLFCIRSSLLQVRRRRCQNFINAQISFVNISEKVKND